MTGMGTINGLAITADTGVITSGTWNATVITPVYGGTGVANNVASTLTITGAYGITLTVSNTTALTLPTSGTLATLAGTEELSNKTFGGIVTVNDDISLLFGGVASLIWETADANANALILAMPDGGATDVPVLVIGDQSVLNADLGFFDGVTEPLFAVIDADADSWVGIGFISDDVARIQVGGVATSIDFNVDVNLQDIMIDEDSGAFNLIDMLISATPAANVEESYAFCIENTPILTIYGEADGSGGLQNPAVKINKDLIMTDTYSIQTGLAVADYFTVETYNTTDTTREEAVRFTNSPDAGVGALIGFYGATPVAQQTYPGAVLDASYEAGELDTEAEVITAINATNTMVNLLRAALINLGLTVAS